MRDVTFLISDSFKCIILTILTLKRCRLLPFLNLSMNGRSGSWGTKSSAAKLLWGRSSSALLSLLLNLFSTPSMLLQVVQDEIKKENGLLLIHIQREHTNIQLLSSYKNITAFWSFDNGTKSFIIKYRCYRSFKH